MHFFRLFVLLFCLQSSCLKAETIFSIEDAITHIQKAKDEHQQAVFKYLNQHNPNAQILDFADIVNQLTTFLTSSSLLDTVGENFTFQQYLNLMQNHLLHLTLKHRIDSSISINDMYPHELPFNHNGLYPAYPTWLALEKVQEFLEILNNKSLAKVNNFATMRIQHASHFIDQILATPDLEQNILCENFSQFLIKYQAEDNTAYLERLKYTLVTNQKLNKLILKEYSTFLKDRETVFINTVSADPTGFFKQFSQSLIVNGPNASFPQLKSVLQQVYLAAATGENIVKAIEIEPRLSQMRDNVLNRLGELLDENTFPYRDVNDEINRCSEFFDIVERTRDPQASNPLHYAKRYAYYYHYVLGLAPRHITIPSTLSFTTYKLLQVSGASVGFGGVAFENLWVDSYLQSPNEFLLHDIANHERRRYQFTRNYAVRLGIPDKSINLFVAEIDNYVQKSILPMLERIKIKEIKAIDYSLSIGEIEEQFIALIHGAEYFEHYKEEFLNTAKNKQNIAEVIDQFRIKINNKKKIFDMIIFEVDHEDAVPPAAMAIKESIMRPPNLKMPRDFIDLEANEAVHSMENAGPTMSYIIHKLNGSFYDTPKKRLQSIATNEYRTPKMIIESTVELIINLGGYNNFSQAEITKRIIYLTMTDEGFLTYLLEEFQRDLHPIQKSLINSLKYAESLEMSAMIGEFKITDEFQYYLQTLKERLTLSASLINDESINNTNRISQHFKQLDNPLYPTLKHLQNKYFRASIILNEKLYADINLLDQSLDKLGTKSESELHKMKQALLKERNSIQAQLESSEIKKIIHKIENLTFQIEEIDRARVKVRNDESFARGLRENISWWNKIIPRDINREELILAFSQHIHDYTWRPYFNDHFGAKASFKPLPDETYIKGELVSELLTRLEKKGYSGFRITPDGVLEQNINTESYKLVPQLHHALSYRPAEKYVDLIIQMHAHGEELSIKLIESYAEKFHVAWMENNYWQLKNSFKILNENITSMNLDDVLIRISRITEAEWLELSTDQITKIRQFVPTENLKNIDKKRNIKVIMDLISIQQKVGVLNKIERTHQATWNELGNFSSKDKNLIAESFSTKMHDQAWLPNYRASNQTTPRYLALPASFFETGLSATQVKTNLEQAGYKYLTINNAGILEQNINTHSKNLIPQIKNLLTKDLAQQYIKIILKYHQQTPVLSTEVLIQMANEIHLTWVEYNRWQLKSAFKKFNMIPQQMSSQEIYSFIRSMNKSQWLVLRDREIEKLKQFSPTESLSWNEHKKNILVLEHLLQNLSSSKLKAQIKCITDIHPFI